MRRAWAWLLGIPRWLLVGLVRFYQRFISPLTPPACRFTPTCSEYARLALLRHGAGKGSLLAGWRLLRCQPFCQGGHEPVPDDWRAAWRRPCAQPKTVSEADPDPDTSPGPGRSP